MYIRDSYYWSTVQRRLCRYISRLPGATASISVSLNFMPWSLGEWFSSSEHGLQWWLRRSR